MNDLVDKKHFLISDESCILGIACIGAREKKTQIKRGGNAGMRYAAAEWLRRSDLDGNLERFFSPSLTAHERNVAEIEGWILGIA